MRLSQLYLDRKMPRMSEFWYERGGFSDSLIEVTALRSLSRLACVSCSTWPLAFGYLSHVPVADARFVVVLVQRHHSENTRHGFVSVSGDIPLSHKLARQADASAIAALSRREDLANERNCDLGGIQPDPLVRYQIWRKIGEQASAICWTWRWSVPQQPPITFKRESRFLIPRYCNPSSTGSPASSSGDSFNSAWLLRDAFARTP